MDSLIKAELGLMRTIRGGFKTSTQRKQVVNAPMKSRIDETATRLRVVLISNSVHFGNSRSDFRSEFYRQQPASGSLLLLSQLSEVADADPRRVAVRVRVFENGATITG